MNGPGSCPMDARSDMSPTTSRALIRPTSLATMAGTELEIVRLRKGKLNRKQVELEFRTEELD